MMDIDPLWAAPKTRSWKSLLILTLLLMLVACDGKQDAGVASGQPTPTQDLAGTRIVATPSLESQADNRIEISWVAPYTYIDDHGKRRMEVVEFLHKYNNSQAEIELIATEGIFVGDVNDPIDIIGPVSPFANYVPGTFVGIDCCMDPPPVGLSSQSIMDIGPWVRERNIDLSDIDPKFLDHYREGDKLTGLPFLIFPSMIYYNRDLFDAAGLPYPPQKVGQTYLLEGEEREWNWDTLADVAKRLTLDVSGNSALSPNFNRERIAQYGFEPQWIDLRGFGTWFGGAYYPVDGGGNADIPDHWKTAWRWYYDGTWGEQPFIPTQAALESELLDSNPFSSGKVAMAVTHLWYAFYIDSTNVPSWDIAIIPSHNGEITASMRSEAFVIDSGTQHPEQAFKVYAYILGEGAAELYMPAVGLPARRSLQSDYLKRLDEKVAPNLVNWQVALDMIPYMDIPSHESRLPNDETADGAFNSLYETLRSQADLDLDQLFQAFEAELNGVYHAGQ